MSERKVRYLSSKYGVPAHLLRGCIKSTAERHTSTNNDILDIIYDTDSQISLKCLKSEIGLRPTNEDSETFENLSVRKLGNVMMAGVFDGHGGPEVSNILKLELGSFLEAELNKNLTSDSPRVVSSVLTQAIIKFDEMLRDRDVYSGSTLTIALMTENMIYTANLGDSRIIIFDSKQNVLLKTRDHKPSDPLEKRRIEAAGGSVEDIWGVPRVNGNLSLSRAIGDFSEMDKPLGRPYSISNVADVLYIERDRPVHILLACDGVWDVMNVKNALDILSKHPSDGCDALIQESLNLGSTDNITVMLLKA